MASCPGGGCTGAPESLYGFNRNVGHEIDRSHQVSTAPRAAGQVSMFTLRRPFDSARVRQREQPTPLLAVTGFHQLVQLAVDFDCRW